MHTKGAAGHDVVLHAALRLASLVQLGEAAAHPPAADLQVRTKAARKVIISLAKLPNRARKPQSAGPGAFPGPSSFYFSPATKKRDRGGAYPLQRADIRVSQGSHVLEDGLALVSRERVVSLNCGADIQGGDQIKRHGSRPRGNKQTNKQTKKQTNKRREGMRKLKLQDARSCKGCNAPESKAPEWGGRAHRAPKKRAKYK